jgi:predicted nucleotidyltransferase
MHTPYPAEDIAAAALFGRARRAILALLFGRAGEAFYLRQVAELTGLAVGSIQRELANLVRAGLVVRTAKGHQVYFRANEASPIYPELVGLVTKTAGVAGLLRAALAPLARKKVITVAFIYGSIAAGEQQSSSDVDLMIIGSIELKSVVPVVRRVEEQIGREVNPTIYRPEDFRQRLAAGEHFLSRIIARPRMMLIGGEDELEGLAGRSLAGRAHHEPGGDRGPARRGEA